MRQLSTRDQMTQKLTAICHRTAFKNEQSPYRIVSCKRPRNDKCKTIQSKQSEVLLYKHKEISSKGEGINLDGLEIILDMSLHRLGHKYGI